MSEGGLSRRQRIAQIWEAVRESQALWAWGDDRGWTPWTDSLGHDVVPLWISADQATEENQDDSEPGERPLFFSLDYVLVRIPAWREAGIAETGLQSEDGGRFLLTIPLEELADRLSRLRVKDAPAVSWWAAAQGDGSSGSVSGRPAGNFQHCPSRLTTTTSPLSVTHMPSAP